MRRHQFTFLATTTNRPFSTWPEQVERVSRVSPPVQVGGKNGLYNGASGACDVVMGQTMMGINADRAYTFTFTDMTGDWGQFFVDAIASITPVAQ